MGDALIEGTFTKVADESWKDRLVSAKQKLAKRTIPAFIEFCQEVHAFRLDCDSTSGGSEFSRKGCEWLGCTPAMLSRWDSVGRREAELFNALKSLPASETAISDLASLDDLAFRKVLPKVQPDMTQKQVREVIKEVSPPRKQEEKSQDEIDGAIRKRLLKMFEGLAPKNQKLVAQGIIDRCRDKGWTFL